MTKAVFKGKHYVIHLLPLKKQTSIHNGIPGLQQTCAHFRAIPLFGEVPLIWSFPRAEVKHFFLKRRPVMTTFKICTEVTDYSRATHAQSIHRRVNFKLIFNYPMSSWEMIVSEGQRTEKKAKVWGTERYYPSLPFYIYIKCLWVIFYLENNYHLIMLSWPSCNTTDEHTSSWCLLNNSYMPGITVRVL